MDLRNSSAIIQWRVRWETVSRRLDRAKEQNQGDLPSLRRAEELGLQFMRDTAQLSSLLHPQEMDWALESIGQAVRQAQAAQQVPDPSVTTIIQPASWISTGGRPVMQLNAQWAQDALRVANPTQVARLLGVSKRTIRRRLLALGLAQPGAPPGMGERSAEQELTHAATGRRGPCSRYSNCTDAQLDEAVSAALMLFPNFGKQMMTAHLDLLGLRVSGHRVAASLRRVAPNRLFGSCHKIIRRIYTVAGPNALWHIDAQLGLRRYGIVIHGIIDGFSRVCVGLAAHTNNRKETFFSLFQEACGNYGTPCRVRGDHGHENLDIAVWMEQNRGLNRGSFLWGRSVHNIRIERLWVDVTRGVGAKWKNFFSMLEIYCGLDPSLDSHLWLLHCLFLQKVKRDIALWRLIWNHHRMRRPGDGYASPSQSWFFGQVAKGGRGLADGDLWAGAASVTRSENQAERPSQRLLSFHEDEAAYARPPEEGGGEMYGVDWTELDSDWGRERAQSTPLALSGVQMDDPRCPLNEFQAGRLESFLQQQSDMDNLEEMAGVWEMALEIVNQYVVEDTPRWE